MYSYETVTEALNDLKKRGFAADFNIQSNAIECRDLNIQLHPADFEIVEFYRFEGDSNPGDEEVVYAIESKEGLKVCWLMHSGPIPMDFLQKFLKN
jgi:hypothetical protein